MKVLKLIPLALSCLVASFSYAGEIAHDQLQPWTNWEGIDGRIDRYQPTYSWEKGCTGHTGVGWGINEYNAGLNPSGAPGSGCRNPLLAQTVAYLWNIPESMQPHYKGNMFAVMYSTYTPKDTGNRPAGTASIGGHRHDWEEVIVYVKPNHVIHKAYYSSHGDYLYEDRITNPAYFRGDTPRVAYDTDAIRNCRLQRTRKDGWQVVTVMINGRSSSENARQTLENNYGCGTGSKTKDCMRQSKFDQANNKT